MRTTKQAIVGLTKVLHQLSPLTRQLHALVWTVGLIIINLPALGITIGNFHSADYSLWFPSLYGLVLNAALVYGTAYFVLDQQQPDFNRFFRNSILLLSIVCLVESQLDAIYFWFFYGELSWPIYVDIVLGTVLMNTILFYLPAIVLGVVLRWTSITATTAPKIKVRDGQQDIFLAAEEVLFVESDSNYAVFHTTRGRLPQRTSLTRLEEELPQQFTRCHRSFIINQDHIQKRSSLTVEVAGQRVPVGRKYKHNIQ